MVVCNFYGIVGSTNALLTQATRPAVVHAHPPGFGLPPADAPPPPSPRSPAPMSALACRHTRSRLGWVLLVGLPTLTSREGR
jgi:hypothetical protein